MAKFNTGLVKFQVKFLVWELITKAFRTLLCLYMSPEIQFNTITQNITLTLTIYRKVNSSMDQNFLGGTGPRFCSHDVICKKAC